MKIVIAGGTGFIGEYLQKRFQARHHQVFIISRQPGYLHWDDTAGLSAAINGADVLINLAGKSVNCRYTKAAKTAILESRTSSTRLLQKIINQSPQPPQVWINASTATIYRHAEDRPMDEVTGEIGTGFSVAVGKAWENAFFEDEKTSVRKVALRIAIVLGKNGGVIPEYERLVKWGMGGRQGNGRQMFSWIHIEDLYGLISYCIEHKTIQGIYNASAPQPVTNRAFMQAMRARLKPLFHFPAPRWLLAAGAALIGTETELLLKSRWVLPAKFIKAGYHFKYPAMDTALTNIL